jgi:heat shock protein HtpX
MEMCVDNPREGFADLFATHPSVDARVEALVKYAGGHDPGPLAVEYDEPGRLPQPEPDGPWGHSQHAGQTENNGKPFLPEEPPVDLGGGPADGPWGPRRN